MILSWVIGSNGMLGSAICRKLIETDIKLFQPKERFRWNCEDKILSQFETSLNEFFSQVNNFECWQIYWAAGLGTMNSSAEDLASERKIITRLLELIGSYSESINNKGYFVFASSAGALYSGTTDSLVDEYTPVNPTTAYGHEKFYQENLIRQLVNNYPNIRALIARITTLYGTEQSTAKQQGLISHIARCTIYNQPIKIFVPFDTIRDYITSEDAAAIIVIALKSMKIESGSVVKIVASEKPTNIAEIISIFKRLGGSKPKVIVATSIQARNYIRRIRFRSVILPVGDYINATLLPIGIARIVAKERARYLVSN